MSGNTSHEAFENLDTIDHATSILGAISDLIGACNIDNLPGTTFQYVSILIDQQLDLIDSASNSLREKVHEG